MASYRYRAKIPANEIDARINDTSADVVVFSKPQPSEVGLAKKIIARGGRVVVDFCDDHFDKDHYNQMRDICHLAVCPTEEMEKVVGAKAVVVPDPYEFEEAVPHCDGSKMLWFGNVSNLHSIQRVLPEISGHKLRIVSNAVGTIPWSLTGMLKEFAFSDIVLLPHTKDYKSPNRALESIRQGCFVVAEPHPSLADIPGIWIGNIKEGIEWASQNQAQANQRTKQAQQYIKQKYSPRIVGNAWKNALARLS